MFAVRVMVVGAFTFVVAPDAKAVAEMDCWQSSEVYGEECRVLGTGGGGSSSGGQGAHKSSRGSSSPCKACAGEHERAFKVSKKLTRLCLDAAAKQARRLCTESSVGAINGRGRSVRPIHDGMLCCEKSDETETAAQHVTTINPSVKGCWLVPVGHQGRVCLFGSAEKWWANKTGHNACPYPWKSVLHVLAGADSTARQCGPVPPGLGIG